MEKAEAITFPNMFERDHQGHLYRDFCTVAYLEDKEERSAVAKHTDSSKVKLKKEVNVTNYVVCCYCLWHASPPRYYGQWRDFLVDSSCNTDCAARQPETMHRHLKMKCHAAPARVRENPYFELHQPLEPLERPKRMKQLQITETSGQSFATLADQCISPCVWTAVCNHPCILQSHRFFYK